MPFCNSCYHSYDEAELEGGICSNCRSNNESSEGDELVGKQEANYPERLSELLRKYRGHQVAINLFEPDKYENCILRDAGEDHVRVYSVKRKIVRSFPYSQLLSITEIPSSSGLTATFDRMGIKKIKMAIHVYHQIIYKGAIGIGFGIRMSDDN